MTTAETVRLYMEEQQKAEERKRRLDEIRKDDGAIGMAVSKVLWSLATPGAELWGRIKNV